MAHLKTSEFAAVHQQAKRGASEKNPLSALSCQAHSPKLDRFLKA